MPEQKKRKGLGLLCQLEFPLPVYIIYLFLVPLSAKFLSNLFEISDLQNIHFRQNQFG